jgi:hypothetical protein
MNFSGLDINTAKGQKTLLDEAEAVKIFNSRFPNVKYVQTAKDRAAKVDAFLVENNELVAIVETKCRYNIDQNKLKSFNNEWLVTWDKIEQSRQIASSLCVRLVGWLYLVSDQTLLTIDIADSNGLLTVPIRIEATKTQRTINGGSAIRNNAYISMDNAKVYE